MLEVVSPTILAWMEERSHLTGLRINACEVRTLVKITLRARKREVVEIVRAAMLASNNVFDVENETREFLWQAVVLATESGALTDELAFRRVHHAGFV